MAASIGPLITLIGGLATAFAFLTTPVGIAVGLIAVLGAGFIYLLDNWEAFKERITDVSFWKNTLISMIQLLAEYNVFSLIIKGFNEMLEFFGRGEIPNPFESLADGLEDLKDETKEYENDFGSFGDAVTNAMNKAKKAVGSLSNAMGIGGGGGGAPEAPSTGVQAQMGPMPFEDDGFFDDVENKNNKLIEGMKKSWADWEILLVKDYLMFLERLVA